MKKAILTLAIFGSMAFAGYIGSGGVNNIKDGGYSEKTSWIVVTCNDGKSYKIGKMDGGTYWWGSSGTLPSEFNGLSANAAAEKACK